MGPSNDYAAATDIALGKVVNSSPLTGDLTVDLVRQELFNRIVLIDYQQQAIDLTVRISDDLVNWIDIYNDTLVHSIKEQRTTEISVDNLTSRYIRISADYATPEVGIIEIKVYNIVTGEANMIEHVGLYGGIAQTVEASQENFHLYLFIGQSNMASRASIDSEDMVPVDRAYLFNGINEWEAAENGLVINLPQVTAIQGLNRYASVEVSTKINGFNLASTFAQVITENDTQIEVGIISNARGGTKLAEWQKGAGTGLYEEAARRTHEAMKSGTLKGILWHQGESDQNEPDIYLGNLKRFVTELRDDFQTPEVPFIIGQLLPTKSALFNQTMTTVPQHIPYSDWVSSEGTTSIGDGTHLDNASQKLFGRRYAERIIEHNRKSGE